MSMEGVTVVPMDEERVHTLGGSGANSGVRSGTLVFRRVGNQR
jgi:hypothetical protein